MNDAELGIKLSKELEKIKNKCVYTFVLSPENYHAANGAIIDHFIKKQNKKGIYVTLNKPCNDMSVDLKSRNIDPSKLYFIDGTGKTNGGGERLLAKKAAHISAARNLLLSCP